MRAPDIHRWEVRLSSATGRIGRAQITARNKKLIRDFDRVCILERLTTPRRIKLISTLVLIGKRYLRKDFDRATAADLKKAYIAVQNDERLSAWTKHDYAGVMKKFWKWLAYGDDYFTLPKTQVPETINWMRVHVKKRDRPKVTAKDILTEDEVSAIINAAQHPRDKCFISMLYETGTRISEIGNLKIRDITKEQYGFVVDVRGKTGTRTPLVVISAPHLKTWLNVHPQREDQDAFLWIRGDGERMFYPALRALVLRLKQRARIRKRVHPHLFRHSRVTHVLARGTMTTSQAEVYFGWIPGTQMISQYSHLVSKNANDAILQSLGLMQPEDPKISVKKCTMCQELNDKSGRFCTKCGNPLDVASGLGAQERRKKAEGLMDLATQDAELMAAFERFFKRRALAQA
jgi:integrase